MYSVQQVAVKLGRPASDTGIKLQAKLIPASKQLHKDLPIEFSTFSVLDLRPRFITTEDEHFSWVSERGTSLAT